MAEMGLPNCSLQKCMRCTDYFMVEYIKGNCLFGEKRAFKEMKNCNEKVRNVCLSSKPTYFPSVYKLLFIQLQVYFSNCLFFL